MAFHVTNTEDVNKTALRTTHYGEVADGLNALSKALKNSQSAIVTELLYHSLETGIVLHNGLITITIDPNTSINEIIMSASE